MALEIERRYLVKLPLTWYARFILHRCKRHDIVQTYLMESERFPPHTRIRRIITSEIGMPNIIAHTMTTKTTIDFGINEESEKEIPWHQYAWSIPFKDQSRYEIWKDRYDIQYSKQKFELDVFRDKLRGLAILEIELDNINTPVRLPPYLTILKDITGDVAYSNYNLSKLIKYSTQQPKEHNPIEQ